MTSNVNKLSIQSFLEICNFYSTALKFYKEKGNKQREIDSFDNFSDIVSAYFEKELKLEKPTKKQLRALYELYLDKNLNLSHDLNDTQEIAEMYAILLNNLKIANVEAEDNLSTYRLLVHKFLHFKNLPLDKDEALYALYKMRVNNNSLTEDEKQNITKNLIGKKDRFKLRKQHPKLEPLAKKGSTFATITATAIIGAIAGTASSVEGFGGFITASKIGNAVMFATNGAAIGAGLAYVGIKIKNLATKLYYKLRYNTSKRKFKALEAGEIKVEDLKINKLIQKVEKTNKKILKLKNKKGLFSKIRRHTLNVVNRNRIHTISDDLDLVKQRIEYNKDEIVSYLTKIQNIQNSKTLTLKEKKAEVANIESQINMCYQNIETVNSVREMIANARYQELLSAMCSMIASGKVKKLENLDIYAKDLLSKQQKKNKNLSLELTHKYAKAIIDGVLSGDITMLGGKPIDCIDNLIIPKPVEMVIPTIVEEAETNEVEESTTTTPELTLEEIDEIENQSIETAQENIIEENVVDTIEQVESAEQTIETVQNTHVENETATILNDTEETIKTEPTQEVDVNQNLGNLVKNTAARKATKFSVEPIIRKGEEVGKRLKVTRQDGTKEKFEIKGKDSSEQVNEMISKIVKETLEVCI
ncbi:MAG: hypothetical protein IKM43_00745 [Clostridia bacterium]|nr:hypothetical protein [Clostridia bacterium]